jgi:hypothetical protein
LRQAEWVGWASGLGGVAIAGTLTFAYFYFQPLPRDEESLCLKSPRSASAVTEAAQHVLLVDKTDKWPEAQGARLRRVITTMRDELGLNERLSIFVFENKVEEGFPPVFSLCNPGRASDTNILTSNPRRWERKFNESFGRPLDEQIDQLTKPAQGDNSPILEILIDITNREELNRGNIPRRIVIVSDMLQNSDAYTFFPKPVAIRVPVPTPRPPNPPGTNYPFAVPPAQPAPPPRFRTEYRTPSIKKLTPNEVGAMVERKGGLPHLKEFKPIVVHQIHGGKYTEEKLLMAREFWETIATEYGAKIEWKRL